MDDLNGDEERWVVVNGQGFFLVEMKQSLGDEMR